MKKTMLYKKGLYNLFAILVLIILVPMVVRFIQKQEWTGALIVAFLGITYLRYSLRSVQSVFLTKDIITEKYLFREISFRANEIDSITINRRTLNFGKGPSAHTYVDIQSTNGHVISIEYFAHKTPDIHEILQSWHKKHLGTRQTNLEN